MATTTKASDLYAEPVWAAPDIKRLRERFQAESETLDAMEDSGARIARARATGSNAELLAALQHAASDADLERQRVIVADLNQQVRDAEQTERQHREDEFWSYAKGEVKRLVKDLDGVVARNASFAKVCDARHDALSGSLEFTENPSLPRLNLMVEGFKQWARTELGLDI